MVKGMPGGGDVVRQQAPGRAGSDQPSQGIEHLAELISKLVGFLAHELR